MEDYKREFIDFMVESNVLKFGEFTLKSGRKSPFFMNAGAYVTGYQLKKLGEFYARAIHDNFGTDFDVLFGPAYKGIPLSVVTAVAFHDLYGKEVKYCSDRKARDHSGADKACWATSWPIATAWSWSRRHHLRQVHRQDPAPRSWRRQTSVKRPHRQPQPHGGRQGRQG